MVEGAGRRVTGLGAEGPDRLHSQRARRSLHKVALGSLSGVCRRLRSGHERIRTRPSRPAHLARLRETGGADARQAIDHATSCAARDPRWPGRRAHPERRGEPLRRGASPGAPGVARSHGVGRAGGLSERPLHRAPIRLGAGDARGAARCRCRGLDHRPDADGGHRGRLRAAGRRADRFRRVDATDRAKVSLVLQDAGTWFLAFERHRLSSWSGNAWKVVGVRDRRLPGEI